MNDTISKFGKLLDPNKIADVASIAAKAGMAKAIEHGPTLLMFTAIGGMATTVYLACKATPAALDARNKRPIRTDENGESAETKVETLVEDAKVMAPHYIPAAITGAGAVACIVGGNRMQAKEIKGLNEKCASLVAAYSLSEKAAMTYQKEVIDKFGEDVHKEIQSKASLNMASEQDCPFDDGYIVNGRENGDTLFYDDSTGFCFWSTEEKINGAFGIVMKDLLGSPQTICDFYAALGCRQDWWGSGQKEGWTVDNVPNWHMWSATCEPDGDIPKRVLSYADSTVRLAL